jgi:hypothetical protein
MSAVQFGCLADQPAALHYDPRELAAKVVLREARGFFRTRGYSLHNVRTLLVRLPQSISLPAFGRNVPTLGAVRRILERLERSGLARQVTPGQWVEAGRG